MKNNINQFTLDSNIVINSSIQKENCLDIVKYFLKNHQEEKCFITPQVKRELSNIQPRISYLLLLIKNEVLKGHTINDSYSNVLNLFQKEDDKKEFKKFSNIINFLYINKANSGNIENFSNAIMLAIGRFIARDIPIKPIEEDCRKSPDKLKLFRDFLRKNNLVTDREDNRIISELMYYILKTLNSIDFITENITDFDYSNNIWKKEPYLSKINVKRPKEFYLNLE